LASIFEIDRKHGGMPWRNALMPASFRGAMFHVETGTRESGRRIVIHEFPKKNEPYSEDMGQIAIQFTVRGYCIVYPFDADQPLYQRDYRTARNLLASALEKEGPGYLQLPTMTPLSVVCMRYRLTENEKQGGYCVFDMQFVEAGKSPFQERLSPGAQVDSTSAAMLNRVLAQMARQSNAVKPTRT